jgi:hypothetical protein
MEFLLFAISSFAIQHDTIGQTEPKKKLIKIKEDDSRKRNEDTKVEGETSVLHLK